MAKSTNYIQEIKKNIKAYKDALVIVEKWLLDNKTSHPDFMKKYQSKNELLIKIKAQEDRKSMKGAGTVGYEYSLPQYSNRN